MDTTGQIIDKATDGESPHLVLQLPDESDQDRESLLPYLILNRKVALDGTSLTLTSVDRDQRTFGVAYAQENIALSEKVVGSKVNVEMSMTVKYTRKIIRAAFPSRWTLD